MCGDCEWPAVFEEKHPTARKTHICCEWGASIDPGETYQLIKGLWDGDWCTFKTCAVCETIRTTAQTELDCIPYGNLYEEIGSEFEEAINAHVQE
jgi:hypothetical protein